MLSGAFLITAAAWAVFAAARRLGPRWLQVGRPPPAGAWLRTSVLSLAAAVLSTAVLGLTGLLSPLGVATAAALLYLASRLPIYRTIRPRRPARQRTSLRISSWPVAASCALLVIDLAVYLPATPRSWDAMTYHLYFPARWLQEGRLFHVPTVFSDNAAAFAPQNGALFFAWQMALSGRDALVNVSQALALLLLALALYTICRCLRVAREPAVLTAVTVLWLPPLRFWTFSANVDVLMIACWLAMVAWQLRDVGAPDRAGASAGRAALAGLAGGLAAGTKTLGLPLVALTALPWLATMAWRRRGLRLGIWSAAAVVGGGWWYLRNAWLYGNPLFPLAIDLGPLRLPGAYDSAAVRAGEFHLAPIEIAAAVLRTFGPVPCALMAGGIVVLAASAVVDLRRGADSPARRRRAARSILLAALAVAWAAFYVLGVPHTSQTRFLLPTLVLGLAGWGQALGWAASKAGRHGSRALWLLAVAGTSAALPPWRGWRASLATLDAAGADVTAWLATAAATAAVLGGIWLLAARVHRRQRAALLAAASVALVAVSLAVATLHADRARGAFLASADFDFWREGYLPFQPPGPLAGEPGLRVAYAGANVPYALMGTGWRHRVVYVNTQGDAGDGFYDHWRRDPRRHPYHKPGLYRGRDDETLWLDRLDAARIDVLAVFRLHPAERRYLWSSPSGFPIEQVWARRNPERFETLLSSPQAEIYRVRPGDVARVKLP